MKYGALGIASAVLMLASCGERDPAVIKAEQTVKENLRDPDSAKFDHAERCGKSEIVTGKLNAKNKFGAYDGEVTFYSDGNSVGVSPMPEESGPFTEGVILSQRQDSGLALIRACTAAIRATLPAPERMRLEKEDAAQDAQINALTDMSSTDMNATVPTESRAADPTTVSDDDANSTDMNPANATDY